ncbi:hypothetical protein [Acidipropionibacterium acidipropionici]|uniref:hypothetical protein n=1 Tax=Acidipropionibacterium acidipropionici TaxID=1748 RepID=UPI000428A94D|nr:hypothetical protein [Acidipropionibacterium acidipropionici]ALN14350.1 hypothetical protein ASQ49_02665 [Acidipropionibacterium acidipropionici]APZ09887.1 hypothetical protein BWX38_12285 [Acidipropionibacterium acidipropionici]
MDKQQRQVATQMYRTIRGMPADQAHQALQDQFGRYTDRPEYAVALKQMAADARAKAHGLHRNRLTTQQTATAMQARENQAAALEGRRPRTIRMPEARRARKVARTRVLDARVQAAEYRHKARLVRRDTRRDARSDRRDAMVSRGRSQDRRERWSSRFQTVRAGWTTARDRAGTAAGQVRDRWGRIRGRNGQEPASAGISAGRGRGVPTGGRGASGQDHEQYRDPRVNRADSLKIEEQMRNGASQHDLQQRFGEHVAATGEGREAAQRVTRSRSARTRAREAVQAADAQAGRRGRPDGSRVAGSAARTPTAHPTEQAATAGGTRSTGSRGRIHAKNEAREARQKRDGKSGDRGRYR